MFNVGPGEIVLISVVALLLLGPDKLPELARGLGKAFREFRKHTEDVRSMVEREFYKMDQDVLHDGAKKEVAVLPEVSPLSLARFGVPPTEPVEEDPRILPVPAFPAFPAPEGVVASRPPTPATVPPLATPTATAAADSAATPHPSSPLADGVPGRDG